MGCEAEAWAEWVSEEGEVQEGTKIFVSCSMTKDHLSRDQESY